MSLLADLLATLSDRRNVPFMRGPRDDDTPIQTLCDRLMASEGEVTGATLARDVLERYARLDEAGRHAFFGYLNVTLDLDTDRLRAALQAYEADHSKASYRGVMEAAQPPRQELIRRLNQIPGATERIVAMREELVRLKRVDPQFEPLDADFKHLLSSWFNRGFLVLRPINWESPAHVLEKIIAYEAVHAIDSWDDLRRRLQPSDRRCFAFFHPAMPDEPLIFVEVALTRGIAKSIQHVLAEERAPLRGADADTAVFYSISNCQSGLAGISFGNSLIKQVVEDLSRELPGLKTFVTLSPVPTLNRWLVAEGHDPKALDAASLRSLCAHYLTEAKDSRGLPQDPVARFHLGNGALLHDVAAGADLSANGLAQSSGTMVNYLYDRARISQNHERFVSSREVPASREVRGLVRAAGRRHEPTGPSPQAAADGAV